VNLCHLTTEDTVFDEVQIYVANIPFDIFAEVDFVPDMVLKLKHEFMEDHSLFGV
jgi:hypothetical protein